MPDKSELFKLIKSLTKSEKRHFKLQAKGFSGQQTAHYEILFNALDKQKEYSRSKTLIALRKAGAKVELPVLKQYLFDYLLKSLASFNSKKDIDNQLSSMINSTKVLLNKKLFKSAEKALAKARRIAQKHERFIRLLEINRIEQLVLQQKGDFKALEKRFESYHEEELTLIEKEKNIRQFRSLAIENFINYYKTPAIRNKKEQNKHLKAMNNPLIKDRQDITSYSSYVLHNISGQYYEGSMDYNSLYKHTKACILIFEDNIVFKNSEQKFYVSAASNHILACIKLRKKTEAENTIAVLNSYAEIKLKNSSPLFYSNTFQNTILLKLLLKFWTFEFKEACSYYLENIDHITSAPKAYVKENEFLLLGALSFFYLGKHNKALDACITIINKPSGIGDYIQSVVRFLNLIIHYELENYNLLDYLITSSYRFLLKRKNQFKTEKVVMNLIKSLAASVDKAKTEKLLTNALSELRGLKNNPFEKKAFEYLDYEVWVRCKLKKIPITQVLKPDNL